jgi:hypothetical protein
MRSFLAFTPAAKQRLEEKLAARRIEEVNALMARPNVDRTNIDIALRRLDKHMDDAAGIIETEKGKGKDVDELTKNISEKFDAQHMMLENIFKAREAEINRKAKIVKDETKKALERGDKPEAEAMSKELDKIRTVRDKIDEARDEAEKKISANKELVEKEMEMRTVAEKAIDKARKAENLFTDEASRQGWTVADDDLKIYRDFLAKADEAMEREHYMQARQSARQAEDALKRLARDKERNDADNGEEKIGEEGRRPEERTEKERQEIERMIEAEKMRREAEKEDARPEREIPPLEMIRPETMLPLFPPAP